MKSAHSAPLLFILLLTLISIHAFSDNCIDSLALKGNWLIRPSYSYGHEDFKSLPGTYKRDFTLDSVLSLDNQSKKLYDQSIQLSRNAQITSFAGTAIIFGVSYYLYKRNASNLPFFFLIVLPITVGLSLDYQGFERLKLSFSVFNQNTRIHRCN
jgi:hypothetical protein